MEACCKCDSIKHTYENCPRRRQDEDFTYLILYRGNKSPVKCSLSLGQVIYSELRRPGSLYHDDQIVDLPHSPMHARQVSMGAKSDAEPSRRRQTLGSAVGILWGQFWTSNNEWGVDDIKECCENCNSTGHSVYFCVSSCGFCGSNNHQTMLCNVKSKACLCQKYPGHRFQQCKQTCLYCYDKENGKGDKHLIKDCPRGCHYCLARHPKVSQCKDMTQAKSRQCSQCPLEAYHFPIIHNACPVGDCKSRIKCKEHCHECG